MASLPPGVDPHTIPILPPPTGVLPNFENPPSIADTATVIVTIMIVLEMFFLTVRLHSNIKKFRTLMADDWMAIAAAILSFGLAFCILYLRPFARHFWNVSLAMDTIDFKKVSFAEIMIFGPAVFAGRAALLLLYYRIFSPSSSFRWKIYVALAIAFGSSMAMVPVGAVLCSPPNGDWTVHNPNCSKSFYYALVQGTIGLMVNLYAFYLPIPMVLKLQIPSRRKVGVLAIFATGLIAIVASAVGLYNRIYMFQNIDPGYAGYIATLCCFIEASVGVICCSMPAMTSFGKLYIFQTSVFTSLRSRLLSHTSLKRRKDTEAPSSANNKRLSPANSCVNGFHMNSFTQLVDDSYFYNDRVAYPRGMTKTSILVGEPSRDVESGHIEKSVTVEQSSDKVSV